MKLIFAGAGASRATAPDKYPTTVEFFEKLLPRTKNDELFVTVEAHLRRTKSTGGATNEQIIIDIEDVLWTLEELGKFAHDVTDTATLIGGMLADGKLHSSMGTDRKIVTAMGPKLQDRVDKLTDEINELVYSLYSQLPSKEEMSTCWLPLLQTLLDTGERIEIATTNYDMVMERCSEYLRDNTSLPTIETGRVAEIQSHLDTSVWNQTDAQTSQLDSKGGGLLTKLHGSIDWTRDGQRTYVGTPLFGGDHSRQVIIYPGYKGAIGESPFDLFHEHLARVVSNARDLVFIDFAFRDDAINELLESRTAPTAKIYTINPSGIPDGIPFAHDRVTHIDDGFNLDSVNELLDQIVLDMRGRGD